MAAAKKKTARAQAGPGPCGRPKKVWSELRVQEDRAVGIGGQKGRQQPEASREASRAL